LKNKLVHIFLLYCLLIFFFFACSTHASDGVKKEGESGLVQIDPFILNIRDNNESRVCKLVLSLELSSPSLGERVKAKMPVIKDSIIMLVTGKVYDDVHSAEGRQQIKDELIASLNQMLGANIIKTVYITDFIIQ